MGLRTIIVTTTFSKSVNDFRSGLALKTVDEAKKIGFEIVVVDGSPDLKFKDALKKAGAIVINESEKGMGASRRQCIKAGFDIGADIIVWTEPEKYSFIPLIPRLFKNVDTEVPHIIVPRRRNLDSYPPYQHFSELRLNHNLGNITGRPELDLPIGPRIISRLAVKYFLDYHGERGDKWESIFIPVLRALSDEVKVSSLIIDYIHHPEQTSMETEDEEMKRKRDEQRESLIEAMKNEAFSLGYKSFPEID